MFVAELLLADADHLFGQRPQRLRSVGVHVVRELTFEPAHVAWRVGLAAVMLGLGQRAACGRVHVLRARHLGSCAPERADTGVRGALGRFQQPVIGHLVQQIVLKGVLARIVERRGVVAHDEALAQQHRQGFERRRVDGRERPVPEHVPHHRRVLQSEPLVGLQRVKARLQHTGEGRRHVGHQQLVGQDSPALRFGEDHAVVEQHLDQFFHVKRVAFRATRQQRAQCGRYLGKAVQQQVGEFVAECLVERPEFDLVVALDVMRPVGVALEERRACQHQCQQRRVVVAGQEVAHKVERAVVAPMQVIQHHHDGPRLAEPPQA